MAARKVLLASASVTPPGAPIKNTLSAIDTRTNKIVWQKTRDGNTSYGAVSTAGGVVFVGQIDGNLVGLDARTGDELWKFQTGWGISAPPMTYSVNGRQFVAVAAAVGRSGLRRWADGRTRPSNRPAGTPRARGPDRRTSAPGDLD